MCLFMLLLSFVPLFSIKITEPADFIFHNSLQTVTTMWKSIKTMHPAWEKLYPVCIAQGDNYYLYQPDSVGNWSLAKTVHRPGQVPQTIRAAYPLDFAENQIACVIDPSVLANQKQMIIVFHEFVHCYQFNTCEQGIKDSLKIYREATAKQNWMWELNYEFSYDNKQIANTYLTMIKAAEKGNFESVRMLRSELKSLISERDWEYLTWQEFKEGTARYLENELNAKYGYHKSTSSHKKPLDRVIFYEGGEKMIRLLKTAQPDLPDNLLQLWLALNQGW